MSGAHTRCYVPLSQPVKEIRCAVGTQFSISGDSLSKSRGGDSLYSSSVVVTANSSVHSMMRRLALMNVRRALDFTCGDCVNSLTSGPSQMLLG